MPRTRSRLSLSERREQAAKFFARGYSNADVARKLNVSPDTVTGYKRWYEERLNRVARENPQMLQDVLRNTIQSMAELDQIRSEAWRTYSRTESEQIKLQALNTIRAAQQDKAKLFGLFGVKTEMWALVTNVKNVQDRLLAFMQSELCPVDREKLLTFLQGPELAAYMDMPELPAVIEVESEEVVV